MLVRLEWQLNFFPSYKEMLCSCVLLSRECQCMAAMVKQTGRQSGMKGALNSVAWICLRGTNPQTPGGLSLDKGNTDLSYLCKPQHTHSRLFPESLAGGCCVCSAAGAREASWLGTFIVWGQWLGSGSVCRAGSCLAAPRFCGQLKMVKRGSSGSSPTRGDKACLVCVPAICGCVGLNPCPAPCPRVKALTKAFWAVSQQLLQQGPGPRCPCAPLPRGNTRGLVLGTCNYGCDSCHWFLVTLCFTHLVFCGHPLL